MVSGGGVVFILQSSTDSKTRIQAGTDRRDPSVGGPTGLMGQGKSLQHPSLSARRSRCRATHEMAVGIPQDTSVHPGDSLPGCVQRRVMKG